MSNNIPSLRASEFKVYLLSCKFLTDEEKIYVSLVGQSLIPDSDCNNSGTTLESCEQREVLSYTWGPAQH
jgi:hypothetical protein